MKNKSEGIWSRIDTYSMDIAIRIRRVGEWLLHNDQNQNYQPPTGDFEEFEWPPVKDRGKRE